MVNYSTNINKTNNQLSPQIIEHKKRKRQQHMVLGFHVLAWDRHKNVVGLDRLMGSQPSPSWKLDVLFVYIKVCFIYYRYMK